MPWAGVANAYPAFPAGVSPSRVVGADILDTRWQPDALVANRVVAGASIGLRASGCKEIANRTLRAALVTRWYGIAASSDTPTMDPVSGRPVRDKLHLAY